MVYANQTKKEYIKEIIPVIHYVDHEQVMFNVDLCVSMGIESIFLINHNFTSQAIEELCKAILDVKEKYPTLWVGVNFLGIENRAALALGRRHGVDGLWCDNANICTPNIDLIEYYFYMANESGEKALTYFGGVEFKYQKQPKTEDLPWVYEQASKYIDVITTSGEGTGKEIDLNKLKRIRETIGEDKLLAVASGVNKDNIKEISQYANYYMVASSITEPNSEYIIREALQNLINNLND